MDQSVSRKVLIQSFYELLQKYYHDSVVTSRVNGKLVLPVTDGKFNAGTQRINLDLGALSNGTYFVRIVNANEVKNIKLVVVH